MTPGEGAMIAWEDRASVPATIALVSTFAGACPDPEAVRARVRERWLPLAPLHRRVRVDGAGQVARPYAWVPPEADAAGVAGRVRRVGPVDTARYVGRLLGSALPLGEPLWGLDVLPSPADDSFTLVLRAHHALLDGTSLSTLIRLLGDDPAMARPPGPARSPVPAGTRAWAGAAGGTLRGLLPLGRARGYNKPVGAERAVDWTAVPAAAVDAARAALPEARATVNDVFLAAVAGALRRELPSDDVHAMIPVNLRSEDRAAELGNIVGGVRVRLPLTPAAPQARLRAVRAAMAPAKEQRRAAGVMGLMGLVAVPAPGAAGRLTGRLLDSPRLWNTLCSSVRLSDRPLSLLGWPMRDAFVLTCLPPRMGFVYVLTRYHDTYTLALTGDGTHGRHLDALADAARDEITLLAGAAART
jgi:hypothetical protein